MRHVPSFVLLACLVGCGGSGHGSSKNDIDPNATIGPKVTIAWPARLRSVGAPAAATAATISFPGAGLAGTDSQVVLRPAGSAGVVKPYALGFSIHPGRRLLRVDFLADANNTGVPLATATVNVTVENDGTLTTLDRKPLGTVAYGSNVTGLAIAEGQTVEVGAVFDPVVTATTANGVVALVPGSVAFTATSGGASLNPASNGALIGVATGTVTLTATVDGVTSPAATVAVLPAPLAARTVSLTTADLVADPTRSRVWVSLPATTANGNSVQSIDVVSGALSTPLLVGADPTVLAISDDGSTLYAGVGTLNAVRRVDLTKDTVGPLYPIPPYTGSTRYATGIAVQPGNPNTYALTTADVGSGGFEGPSIYDSGVERANSLGTYEGSGLLWTSADRIVAYGGYGQNLFDVAVDAQGATATRSTTAALSSAPRLTLAGGRLYDSGGIVLDGLTLAAVGQFRLTNSTNESGSSFYGPVVDASTNHAYFVEVSDVAVHLRAFDDTTYVETGARRISNVGTSSGVRRTQTSVVRVGSKGIAFRLADQVVFVDDVSGL